MNEIGIAKAIASGQLPSPQVFGNSTLYAIRITGTNVTWRGDWDTFIFRDPKHYLTDEFLQRCNGLEVIFEHPETKDRFLDTEEYRDRIIGSSIYPYIHNDEVWTVARIRDDAAIAAMQNGYIISTSPAITVQKGNTTEVNGNALHIEGMPIYIDHIAVLSGVGVWDKSSINASGILNGYHTMAEQPDIKEEDTGAGMTPDAETTPPPAAAPVAEKTADITAELLKVVTALAAKIDKMEGDMSAIKSAEVAEVANPKVDEIASQVADMQSAMPANIDDKEKDDIADLEMRAVDAFTSLGLQVKKASGRDTLKSYQRRVLDDLKRFSPAYKDVSVDSLFADANLLQTADRQIFADAKNAAKNPVMLAGETLRAIETHSGGRTITEYVGGDSLQFNPMFSRPPQQIAAFGKRAN
jgi:hypothetical protein